MGIFFGTPVSPMVQLRDQQKAFRRVSRRIERLAKEEQEEAEETKKEARHYILKGDNAFAQIYCNKAGRHRISAMRLHATAASIDDILTRLTLATIQAEVPNMMRIVARAMRRLNRAVPMKQFNQIAQGFAQDLATIQVKIEMTDEALEVADETTDDAIDLDGETDAAGVGKQLFETLLEESKLLQHENGVDLESAPSVRVVEAPIAPI